MQLEDGYLIVLPRDEAKTFFGHRENEPRLAFLNEALASADSVSLCLDGKWQALHDALAAVELENSVLEQCVLGGRPMHRGEDYLVNLVRPDIVGFIAEQGKVVGAGNVADDLAALAQSVIELFSKAAALGGAVVFVARK